MTPHWSELLRLWSQTAWRFRYLICLLLVLLPMLFGLAGLLRPRSYESHMSILIQEAAKHNPILEDLAVDTRVRDRLSALRAMLHSRHVLLGVAVDLEWIDDDSPAEEREDVVRRLSQAIKVRLIGDELIELTYRQDQPEDIERVLLAIAQRFMDKVLAPERSSISGSVAFLEDQLTQSAEALEAAEGDLSAFRSRHASALPELHAANVRRLADLRTLRAERQTELEGAKAQFADLKHRLLAVNPVVARIEHQIVDLRGRLASLRGRYTERHSAVRAAESALDRLLDERHALIAETQALDLQRIEQLWGAALRRTRQDSGLQQLLVSQVESLRTSHARVVQLERQITALDGELTELDGRIAGFGEVQRELDSLERALAVKRDVHTTLQKRAEMARVTGALGQFEAPERIKVIDQPTIPTRPSGLPAVLFVALGLFMAVGLSAGLVAVVEVLERSVRTGEQAARLVGAPLLALMPAVPRLETDLADLAPRHAGRLKLMSWEQRR